MKINKIGKIIFIVLFLSIITLFPLFTLVDADRTLSVIENRFLAQTPKINKTSLLNGEFFSKFEKYFSDQLYGRDLIMNAYSNLQLEMLKKRKINDVVIGNEDYLLPYNEYINDKTQEINIINSVVDSLLYIDKVISECGGNLYYLNIPHKSEIYADKYPQFFENGYDNYLTKYSLKMNRLKKGGINVVDVTQILEEKKEEDEYIYFKTDHHYNFKGAYYTYKELIKKINENEGYDLKYPEWESMNKQIVNKKFVGSYLKKTGNIHNNFGDYYEYAFPDNYPKFERFESGKKYPNLLFKYDEYAGEIVDHDFLLGNRANTVIKTYRDWLPNILIIGYSYTNNLESMAVYNFNEMHSIDPRTFNGNITDYIQQHKLDIVVVVRDDLYEGNPSNKATIK